MKRLAQRQPRPSSRNSRRRRPNYQKLAQSSAGAVLAALLGS